MISSPLAFLPVTFVLQLLYSSTCTAFYKGGVSVSPLRSMPTLHAVAIKTISWDGEYDDHGITRRELFHSAALGGAALCCKPCAARATTEVAPRKSNLSSAIVSNTLCDPSVSTWVKSYDDAMRTVHILGTAHISSSSAELAGKMVRELKPNVVFVELDAKRVARAIPGGVRGSRSGSGNTDNKGNDGSKSGGYSAEESNQSSLSSTTTTNVVSTPSAESNSPKTSNPFDVQSKLVNAGSKVVGNSVKSMYSKLESEGFKAGDEFAMSVREGLAIGATIVLGDRDVEVTLQRLTKAITKTDIRKLLSADSEVEKSMEALLPEGMKSQLKQPSYGLGGNGDGNSSGATSMGMDDVTISKQDFNTFVETMKAKENVRNIMSALQKTAPEIYEAMVAERDIYMGQGIDELGLNLKGLD
ncbi:hypothetical protein ACHAXH_003256 [Discostella pseudostelligera]